MNGIKAWLIANIGVVFLVIYMLLSILVCVIKPDIVFDMDGDKVSGVGAGIMLGGLIFIISGFFVLFTSTLGGAIFASLAMLGLNIMVPFLPKICNDPTIRIGFWGILLIIVFQLLALAFAAYITSVTSEYFEDIVDYRLVFRKSTRERFEIRSKYLVNRFAVSYIWFSGLVLIPAILIWGLP